MRKTLSFNPESLIPKVVLRMFELSPNTNFTDFMMEQAYKNILRENGNKKVLEMTESTKPEKAPKTSAGVSKKVNIVEVKNTEVLDTETKEQSAGRRVIGRIKPLSITS